MQHCCRLCAVDRLDVAVWMLLVPASCSSSGRIAHLGEGVCSRVSTAGQLGLLGLGLLGEERVLLLPHVVAGWGGMLVDARVRPAAAAEQAQQQSARGLSITSGRR